MNRPNRKGGKEFPRKKQPRGQEPVAGKELPGGKKKGQDDTVPSRRGRGRMRRCGKKHQPKRFIRELRGKWRGFFAVLSFFFCVPKKRNKKMAPQPVLALRASLTSRRGRDAKKLGLRPQTVGVSATMWLRLPPASFSALVCEARQDKWGGKKFPLARSRAPERLPKRGFALFERSEFAKPRQHQGAQGIPPAAGQETQGAFSLVRFFGQAKK